MTRLKEKASLLCIREIARELLIYVLFKFVLFIHVRDLFYLRSSGQRVHGSALCLSLTFFIGISFLIVRYYITRDGGGDIEISQCFRAFLTFLG